MFLPLLPATSALFDNIAKEIEESIDTNPYVPLHQLDEQPKLIEGGTMKDYQVSPDCSSAIAATLMSLSASRTVFPGLDVSERYVD